MLANACALMTDWSDVVYAMHSVALILKGWGVPFGTAVVSDLPQRQMDIAAQVHI
jgi:hypothetical protein